MSISEFDVTDDRRELARMKDSLATVRLSLDGAGSYPRLIVEDLETGEEIALSAAELILILERGDVGENWTVWRTG